MAKATIAVASVLAAGAAGYSAVAQDQASAKSRRMQRTAQQQASNAAMKQEALAEQSIKAANKKQPDVAALLAEAQQLRPPSTMLTGPTGLPSNNLLGF